MKKYIAFLSAVLFAVNLFAQTPEKMSYQAVIRDSGNNLVRESQISMQISILQGSENGTAVYVETQNPVTNANGLVSIEIGGEDATVIDGDFSTINWANNIYFIKTETTISGGEPITGVSQILSVPYALHAKTAETVSGTVTENDPVYSVSPAANITSEDITNLSNLSGINTGDQDLSNLSTKAALADSTARVRSEIPDVSSFLSSETDPVYRASKAAQISSADILHLSNLSGINTGDQDLSGLATKKALADSTVQLRSEIPDVSGFLSSENDPVYTTDSSFIKTGTRNWNASIAKGITSTDTANWNNKLESYTETDPVFTLWDKSTGISITEAQITDLKHFTGDSIKGDETAFNGWDKDVSDDFTNADETDPVYATDSSFLKTGVRNWNASVAKGITSSDTANWNNDTSVTNEIQLLFISNDTVYIEQGGFVKLPLLSQIVAINDSVGSQLKNVTDPKDTQDAATKNYVDSLQNKLIDSLTNDNKTLSYLLDSKEITKSDLIGLFYQGGIVFNIDTITNTGLICAVSDQGSLVKWNFNDNYSLIGTEAAMGKGQFNTTSIVAVFGTGNYAAYLCDTLELNGYDDWFLPSKNELDSMFHNKTTIDSSAIENGGSAFVPFCYWSSTEKDGAQAWNQDFNSGTQYVGNKRNLNCVRAIRSFDLNTSTWDEPVITQADINNWNNKLDSFVETDPVFAADSSELKTGVRTWNVSVAKGITSSDTTNWNTDTSATNELQVLSISNDTIYLTNGGFVKLPAANPVSLDSAYNHGTTITSDAGPVTIAGTDGLISTGTFGTGNDLAVSGSGTRMMWYPKKAAFRVGYVRTTYWDADNIGSYSFATGYSTLSNGFCSVAMGNWAAASGFCSIAMGDETIASGEKSVAMGYYTNAGGDYSTAFGTSTTASGHYSTVMGWDAIASGIGSTSIGFKTTASGKYTNAMGISTTAQAYGSLVLGQYNTINGTTDSWVSTDPLFVIGNGTDDSNRSNAVTVLKNGNIGIGVADPDTTLEVAGLIKITGGTPGAGKVLTSDADGLATWQTVSNTTSLDGAYNHGSTITADAGPVNIAGTDGIISTGTYGTGTTLSPGAGLRLHWYPRQGAFRVGLAETTYWDDSNIGIYSIAMGYQPRATAPGSVAIGAFNYSTADFALALGYNSHATASYGIAIGCRTIASGQNSIAIGTNVDTNGKYGSMVISDHHDDGFYVTASDDCQMTMRFDNGYRLFTSETCVSGVTMSHGDNSWSSVSDSTKKENIIIADGDYFLNSLSQLKLGSWNYKTQNPAKFRHYGPMAQEIFHYFGKDEYGIIGNDTTLASADMDGIMMICLQALEKRTKILSEQNSELKAENENQKKEIAELRQATSENIALQNKVAELEKYFEELKTLVLETTKEKETTKEIAEN